MQHFVEYCVARMLANLQHSHQKTEVAAQRTVRLVTIKKMAAVELSASGAADATIPFKIALSIEAEPGDTCTKEQMSYMTVRKEHTLSMFSRYYCCWGFGVCSCVVD